MDKELEKIYSYFKSFDIELSTIQQKQFLDYYKLLIEWNLKFNLTAITDFNEVLEKHFLDSVQAFKLFRENSTIIDIGCGAGFPSIPIKILRPDLNFTLVDSVNKKIIFLNEIISALNLKSIKAIHSRAEDLAKKKDFRENFDYSIARAVSKLNTLYEYTLPFLKINGKLIAYKSCDVEEEIEISNNACKELGGIVENIINVSFSNFERKLVVVNKVNSTSSKYPRSGNKPRLQPL